jgi:PIN domain nuclease of toxin-antitoxin system
MPEQLPAVVKTQLESCDRPLFFSVVSLWEVAIMASLGRGDFQVDSLALRTGLLQEGFRELPIQVEHVLRVQHLP